MRFIASVRHPGEVWELPNGDTIKSVHFEEDCIGETCVIHRPTQHHMCHWPLHWRSDRMIFERLCSHGIGHPDPDNAGYFEAVGDTGWDIHGCDGCCVPVDRVAARGID